MRTAERCCARGILWSRASGLALSTLVLAACGGSNSGDDVCLPDDADGVVGGPAAFDLTVDDTGFTPTILTAQNLANVTLTLHNTGTKSHGFAVDCMPTPNDNGCPITSCFPDDTTIAAVDPGGMALGMFIVPNPEGIYYFHSSVAGDAPAVCMMGLAGCGQFIVK